MKELMNKSHLPMIGLSCDFETTGSTWGGNSAEKYQGISCGVVAFNTRTFEEIDSMYMEIQFDDSKYEWTKGAEAIHGLSQEHLAKNGLPREDAAIKLAEFILKYCGTEPVVMMAHNVSFDIDFTNQLLGDFDIPFQSHPCRLDTSGMSFICLGINNSNKVFEFFGLEERIAHNALEDARLVLEVARQYHSIFQEIFA